VVETYAGTKTAIEHLQSLGHRKIGFLGGRAHQGIAAARETSFRRAMKILLSQAEPVTAILCANDLSAIGPYQALRQTGAAAGIVHAMLAPRIHHGSGLATAFYGAIIAAVATAAIALLLSWPRSNLLESMPPGPLSGVRAGEKVHRGLLLLCLASFSLCCILYWHFR
jgi:hypothetical protein